MSDIENPQAFPLVDGPVVQPGMDLRDWFAGQAMSGLSGHMTGARAKPGETAAEAEARWCYERADAMLAARKGAAA